MHMKEVYMVAVFIQISESYIMALYSECCNPIPFMM